MDMELSYSMTHTSPFLSDVKLLNRIDRFTWKTSNLYDNSVYMKRVRSYSNKSYGHFEAWNQRIRFQMMTCLEKVWKAFTTVS